MFFNSVTALSLSFPFSLPLSASRTDLMEKRERYEYIVTLINPRQWESDAFVSNLMIDGNIWETRYYVKKHPARRSISSSGRSSTSQEDRNAFVSTNEFLILVSN